MFAELGNPYTSALARSTNMHHNQAAKSAAFFIGEDMKINPTSTRRIVVIDIQTRTTDEALPNLKAAAGTEVITGIQVTVDDGALVVVASFADAAEIDLLRDFWEVVQPDDVFYGCQALDRLVLLRRRTWAWGLIPSRELSLPMVYRHDVVETGGVRANP